MSLDAAPLETDYLVVGAGAMGMAFTDVLLTETDATVTLVDRRAKPGGHWNDAYPFVRLHQPSSFYGVNSRPLGSDTLDTAGWNEGLYELASGAEVVAYFDQLLNQRFLPSGRVTHLPMSEYLGDGRVRSVVAHRDTTVHAGKVVDATYMNVTVPSMGPPQYDVEPGVHCVPLNELPKVAVPPTSYVVVGAGKTGMDACLWLLANGVDPDAIMWIMPRDSWLLDRANIQPGNEFFHSTIESFARQFEVINAATTIDELFAGLDDAGLLLRLDPDVRPTMYRCATVTEAELDQLRRIENVVRLGRVRRIGTDEIELEQGSIPTDPDALHVDCTADGLERRPVVPVFDGDRITLQAVRTCQQVFSAAFIAHVAAAYDDDATKNDLCTVVPHPNSDLDWIRSSLTNNRNAVRWREDAELTSWLEEARLNPFGTARLGLGSDAGKMAVIRRLLENTMPAIAKLEAFVAEIDRT